MRQIQGQQDHIETDTGMKTGTTGHIETDTGTKTGTTGSHRDRYRDEYRDTMTQ